MKMYKVSGYMEAILTFDPFNGTNELPYPRLKDIENIIEEDIDDYGLQELDEAYGISFNCDRIEGTLTVDFEIMVKDKEDQKEIDDALEEWKRKYISYDVSEYTFNVMNIIEVEI